MYGITVARATAWTWALFPYVIYWPVRVVWETSFTAFLLSLALLLTLRMADEPPRAAHLDRVRAALGSDCADQYRGAFA